MMKRRRLLLALGAGLIAPGIEAQPKVRRIGYLTPHALIEPPTPERAGFLAGLRELGYQPGRNLIIEYRAGDSDFDRLPDLAAELVKLRDALMVIVDARLVGFRKIISDAAMRQRIPCLAGWREFVTAGALASYAPDFRALFHRLAFYVDRILRGAKPADLPVEQPTKFELVLNLKTAKAIGIAIPPPVLVRADEVIQ